MDGRQRHSAKLKRDDGKHVTPAARSHFCAILESAAPVVEIKSVVAQAGRQRGALTSGGRRVPSGEHRVFCVLVVVAVMGLHAFVKTHEAAPLKLMNFMCTNNNLKTTD